MKSWEHLKRVILSKLYPDKPKNICEWMWNWNDNLIRRKSNVIEKSIEYSGGRQQNTMKTATLFRRFDDEISNVE